MTAETARATQQITLDYGDAGKVFDGVGAASGGGQTSRLLINYPEPERSQILDYLFKPKYGANLQILKVEIGGDGNSTEGSEPSHMHSADDLNFSRGVEWWLMKEAKRRNPSIKLYALAWDFPGWLKQADSQATCDYLAKYLEGARKVHHLRIDYIGIWNETPMPDDFVKKLRATLDAHHLATKIAADDSVNSWDLAVSMKRDSALAQAVAVLNTHYPRFTSSEAAEDSGKPIWSAEDGPWNSVWRSGGEQSGPYAEIVNRNYVQGRMTATILWCAATSYYDILDDADAGLLRARTPWSGYYEITAPVWIVAHTTQFAQPGWRYMDHASGLLPDGGSYATLRSGRDFSMVVESMAAAHAQEIEVKIDPRFPGGALHVWKTDEYTQFEQMPDLQVTGGKIHVTIAPGTLLTLTTTKGQHKGNAKPPADMSFPLPYRDTFEEYRSRETTPRYFIEQNGSYEVQECMGGREGRCLGQVVTEPPIVWTSGKKADQLGTASIIGDAAWSNYKVSVDYYLPQEGYARIMGRVSRVTLDGQIAGYQLYLRSDGRWSLQTSTQGEVLASGRLASTSHQWRTASLTFNRDQISVDVDGQNLSKIADLTYATGMAGIGNGYNRGQYDDFTVQAVEGVDIASTARLRAKQSGLPKPTLYVPTPLNHAARLSWSKIASARGYKLKVGTKKGEYTSTLDLGNNLAYRMEELEGDKTYYCVVLAYGDSEDSDPSDAVEVRALPLTAEPRLN